MSRDDQADRLYREASAAAGLVASLASDDEVLLHDMVEGETSLLEAIEAALAEIDDCEVTVEGCRAKEAQFAERRNRAERRIEKVRGLVEQAMLVASLPKVKLATATLTVSNRPPAPFVDDESKVPSAYWKARDPVIDKALINAAVKSGETIPGVSMTNGRTSLTIRRV